MNKDAQELFDRLVKLDVAELTAEDKDFLRARRNYMNSEQKRVYADVIKDVVVVDETKVVSKKK